MTVLSVKFAADDSAGCSVRASCTGMRTGVASGKKRASPATVLAFCAARPVAVACCAKRMRNPLPRLVLPDQNAVGLPLFPVRKSCGEPRAAVRKKKEQHGSQISERKD